MLCCSQPVVTESVGTFAPADDQDSFYQDLMVAHIT